MALGAGENPEGGQTESGNAETAAAVDNPCVPAASERTASEEAASPPPRETRAVQLPLPAAPSNGLLTINAQPVYAYVEVDGIELPKSTPIFQHPRAPGRHVLTIRREGYETVVDTVEITAGDETRRSYVLIAN